MKRLLPSAHRPDGYRVLVLLDGAEPYALGPDAQDARTLVVADDANERLERVASAGMGPGPSGRWQRHRLRRELVAAGDAAELLPLRRNATSDARACLLRARPTPTTRDALAALVGSGTRIVAVTTAARLLADAYGRHRVPRLFVARTSLDERHVLVVDGVPCFVRTLAFGTDACGRTDMAAETAAAVADSLEHLAGRYAAGRVDVGGIGLDDASLDACRALPHAGDARHVARTPLEVLLARRMVERAGPVCLPGVRRRTAHVPALLGGVEDRPEAGASPWRRRAATGAALLSLGAGAAATGNAFVAIGERDAHATAAIERLTADVAAERAALTALDAEPLRAAAHLLRGDALAAGAPPDPATLLGTLARALDAHADLEIDSVAWSVAPERVDIAATESTLEPEAGPAFVDAEAVPWRTPDPLALVAAGARVELAGRVSKAATVGEAERALDGLVATLIAVPRVEWVVRLESPLERVAAGARIDGEVAWRLRLGFAGRRIEP